MLKINSKAPNFTLSSTSKDKYSLKDSLENMLSSISIQKTIHRDAL
jgi:peroxiredoxin